MTPVPAAITVYFGLLSVVCLGRSLIEFAAGDRKENDGVVNVLLSLLCGVTAAVAATL